MSVKSVLISMSGKIRAVLDPMGTIIGVNDQDIIDDDSEESKEYGKANQLKQIDAHRHGHELTIDDFIRDEYNEYFVKVDILKDIRNIVINHFPNLVNNHTNPNIYALYHELPIERAADKASGASVDVITKAIYDYCPNYHLTWISGNKFIQYKLPYEFVEARMTPVSNINDLDRDIVILLHETYDNLYKSVIKDSRLLRTLIDRNDRMFLPTIRTHFPSYYGEKLSDYNGDAIMREMMMEENSVNSNIFVDKNKLLAFIQHLDQVIFIDPNDGLDTIVAPSAGLKRITEIAEEAVFRNMK